MLRCTFLRCASKRDVFQLFCRDQLLVNYSLRSLSPAERRTLLTASFKQLPKDSLLDLTQRAAIEEARLATLQRAAAAFRPLTPYEFFVKEQQHNPAIGGSATPREREVKLLQIYETLPDNAKEALATRAELYNTSHSKVPEAPALPAVNIRRTKKATPPKKKKPSKKKKKKASKNKKRRHAASKTTDAAADNDDGAEGEAKEVQSPGKRGKDKKAVKTPGKPSPYAIFVKEQMASLHDIPVKERMKVIGERWRSLTPEEREQRMAAARHQIAMEHPVTTAASPLSTGEAPPAPSNEAATATAPSSTTSPASALDAKPTTTGTTESAAAPSSPKVPLQPRPSP